MKKNFIPLAMLLLYSTGAAVELSGSSSSSSLTPSSKYAKHLYGKDFVSRTYTTDEREKITSESMRDYVVELERLEVALTKKIALDGGLQATLKRFQQGSTQKYAAALTSMTGNLGLYCALTTQTGIVKELLQAKENKEK